MQPGPTQKLQTGSPGFENARRLEPRSSVHYLNLAETYVYLGKVGTARHYLARARKLGYRRMLLDTVSTMHTANALYASLGFRPTEPYCYNPLPDAAFFALDLRGTGG